MKKIVCACQSVLFPCVYMITGYLVEKFGLITSPAYWSLYGVAWGLLGFVWYLGVVIVYNRNANRDFETAEWRRD